MRIEADTTSNMRILKIVVGVAAMRSAPISSPDALLACLGAIALFGPLVGCHQAADNATACTELNRFSVEVGRQKLSLGKELRPIILNEKSITIPRHRFQDGAFRPVYCKEDLGAAGRITGVVLEPSRIAELPLLYPKLRHVTGLAYSELPPPSRRQKGLAIQVAALTVVEDAKGFEAYSTTYASSRADRIDFATCAGRLQDPPAICRIYLAPPRGSGSITFVTSTTDAPLEGWGSIALSARAIFASLSVEEAGKHEGKK